MAVTRQHRHSYLSERMRLDLMERELCLRFAETRLLSAATLASAPHLNVAILLASYKEAAASALQWLPPYLTATRTQEPESGAATLAQRYHARKAELEAAEREFNANR